MIHNLFKFILISILFSDLRGCIMLINHRLLSQLMTCCDLLKFYWDYEIATFHPCIHSALWVCWCPVYKWRWSTVFFWCIIFSNYVDAVIILNMFFFAWEFFVTTFIATMKLLNVADMHAIHQLNGLLSKMTFECGIWFHVCANHQNHCHGALYGNCRYIIFVLLPRPRRALRGIEMTLQTTPNVACGFRRVVESIPLFYSEIRWRILASRGVKSVSHANSDIMPRR